MEIREAGRPPCPLPRGKQDRQQDCGKSGDHADDDEEFNERERAEVYGSGFVSQGAVFNG